jgi:hypothetical protein
MLKTFPSSKDGQIQIKTDDMYKIFTDSAVWKIDACSATAPISYPASLSNLPNGCQGHPCFYPPPDRSPITKPDSNYVLTRCNFYSTIGMG